MTIIDFQIKITKVNMISKHKFQFRGRRAYTRAYSYHSQSLFIAALFSATLHCFTSLGLICSQLALQRNGKVELFRDCVKEVMALSYMLLYPTSTVMLWFYSKFKKFLTIISKCEDDKANSNFIHYPPFYFYVFILHPLNK